MKYEVYLDRVFIIHFVIHYCTLGLNEALLGLQSTFRKRLFAALIGGISGCLMVLPIGIPVWIKIGILLIAGSASMIRIAFRIRGLLRNICLIAGLTCTLFSFGGIAYWIVSQRMIPLSTSGWSILFLSIYVIAKAIILRYRKRKDSPVAVTVIVEDEESKTETELAVVAIWDSGNTLREASTQKAVSVMERNAFKILDKDLKYQIPFHSIGKHNATMPGRIVKRICIHTREGDIVAKDVMIALCEEKISTKGAYHMILHPELRDLKEK